MQWTDTDRRHQREIADELERAWDCQVIDYGELTPIDGYVLKGGRLVALVEMKDRPHPSGRFPTVFIGLRKWLALQLGQVGMGVPSLFVPRFTDGIRWCRVSDIDARRFRMGGRHVCSGPNDWEPVIEVPVCEMHTLADARLPGGAGDTGVLEPVRLAAPGAPLGARADRVCARGNGQTHD